MASQQTGRRNKHQSSKAGSQPGVRKLASSEKKSQHRDSASSYGHIFDERTKRDISAVALIVLSIALFAMVFMGSEGVVTGAISLGLRFCFGIGAYVLPFLLIGLAATLLIRFEREMVPARVAIGFGLLFLAFLTIVSFFTPGADVDPNRLFIQVLLVDHGGYVGGAIAWAGLELFGLTVSMILMIGLIIIALIVIGFSLSSLIESIRAHAAGRSDAPGDEEGGFDHLPRMSFARVRKGKNPIDAGYTDPTKVDVHGSMPTQAIDANKAAFAAGKTQVISEMPSKSLKKSQRTNGQRAREAAVQTTMAFDAASPKTAGDVPKQLTRKLGSRPKADKKDEPSLPQYQAARPVRKKASDVATPEPLEGFDLPEMSLLNTSEKTPVTKESEASLRATGLLLQETLSDFGVGADVVGWVHGPTVTLFKVDLPSGVRVNRVSNLTDDIALALAAPGVRIFAPIPGTNYVGIEVPNKKRETVFLGDVLKDAPDGPLQIAIGKDVEGESIVSNLATMPHLLIGGTTGSGKSVAINGMIMSILMRATPSEVRMIMIDPKRVEFTPYNGIPHLYVPVVTEAREAASALSWAVAEMERRLKVFSGIGARNIGQYNAKVQKGLEIDDAPAAEMPYIVIIIDELADLMMNVGKEVEFSISRLAQLARAAGIHLIVATQRPSTNVVTGLIKANITNRIAFNVASGIDSRVILDTPGAENLIGLGDLLLSKPELAKPQRIQGCFVSEDEISAVVEKLKSQGEPEYHNDILKTNLITLGDSMPDGSGGTASGSDDPLVWDAAEIVVSSGMGSTSNLQRRLSVGYSRAGRIMDLLEEKGIVGPPNGSKPREVLVDPMELETIKAFEANDSQ
ncbi:putative uncharacterized protein [Eggerthella sp. CAG:209]|nr:putative uncharacterized protein [Eggerthella sp. CAG:209]